ncbi:hypothetical protein ACF1BP_33420 [Streptomyces sp. NPDC014735]|uniref:hypothetical protein n=1 Tax=unclassified Streptomyces TaxID=2593676 RepID=UPI003700E303
MADASRNGRQRVVGRCSASAAATGALALNIDETPVSSHLSMSDVGRVRERIDRLDAHFSAIGSRPLLTVATAYLDRLTTAADHCTYGPRVEQALHTAVASLCSSAGWAADDAEELDAAHLRRTAHCREPSSEPTTGPRPVPGPSSPSTPAAAAITAKPYASARPP